MERYKEKLRDYANTVEPDQTDVEKVLATLYECYNERTGFDNKAIKTAFRILYQAMSGKSLQEMDEIIYPVCTLCREHEKAGFAEGVKVGLRLGQELSEQ